MTMRPSSVEAYLAHRQRNATKLSDDDQSFLDSIRRDNGLLLRSPQRRTTSPGGEVDTAPQLRDFARDSSRLAHQAQSFAHETTRLNELVHTLKEEVAQVRQQLENEQRDGEFARKHQRAMAAEFLKEKQRLVAKQLQMEESVIRHQLIAVESQLWAHMATQFAKQCMLSTYNSSDDVSMRSQRFVNDLRALYDEIGHQAASRTDDRIEAPRSPRRNSPLRGEPFVASPTRSAASRVSSYVRGQAPQLRVRSPHRTSSPTSTASVGVHDLSAELQRHKERFTDPMKSQATHRSWLPDDVERHTVPFTTRDCHPQPRSPHRRPQPTRRDDRSISPTRRDNPVSTRLSSGMTDLLLGTALSHSSRSHQSRRISPTRSSTSASAHYDLEERVPRVMRSTTSSRSKVVSGPSPQPTYPDTLRKDRGKSSTSTSSPTTTYEYVSE